MSRFVLSPKSIGLLAEAIAAGNTDSQIDVLLLKAGVDAWEPDTSKNKLDKATRLIKNLRSRTWASASAADVKEANDGALELVRLMLAHGKGQTYRRDPAPWWQPLVQSIAADGWEFDAANDRLIPTVPGVTTTEEVAWIEEHLVQRGWTSTAGHYRQAVDNFASGNWAGANGQLRTFFEDLLLRVAAVAPGPGAGQIHAALRTLDANGKLVQGESDFARALWRLLHAAGSHPGLSDRDESRFRLLALTGYARYLLGRV